MHGKCTVLGKCFAAMTALLAYFVLHLCNILTFLHLCNILTFYLDNVQSHPVSEVTPVYGAFFVMNIRSTKPFLSWILDQQSTFCHEYRINKTSFSHGLNCLVNLLAIIMSVGKKGMKTLNIEGGSTETLRLCRQGLWVDSVHDGSKVPFSVTPKVHYCQVQVSKDPQIVIFGSL